MNNIVKQGIFGSSGAGAIGHSSRDGRVGVIHSGASLVEISKIFNHQYDGLLHVEISTEYVPVGRGHVTSVTS